MYLYKLTCLVGSFCVLASIVRTHVTFIQERCCNVNIVLTLHVIIYMICL